MNYKKLYNLLITKAQRRNRVVGYFEVHHILPKSLGGLNTSDNLVKLTAREHFIAHKLLFNIYRNREMGYAYHMMCVDRYGKRKDITSKEYEEARKALSFANSLRIMSKESKLKISVANTGRIKSLEERMKKSQEMLKNNPMDNPEYRKKVSLALKGRPRHPNSGIKKGTYQQKTKCPHCSIEGGVGGLKRYHFDNCKTLRN